MFFSSYCLICSEEEEVFLSEPSSGEEEDAATDGVRYNPASALILSHMRNNSSPCYLY
jgi:hypothetical protein